MIFAISGPQCRCRIILHDGLSPGDPGIFDVGEPVTQARHEFAMPDRGRLSPVDRRPEDILTLSLRAN